VDIDAARSFIAANHHAVIAVTRPDGRPQLSPVTIGLHPDGHAEISTRQTAAKVRALRRDPHVTVCVMNDRFFGEWIFIEGTAEIVELPEAMEGLVEYYRRVSGEHPDWDDYRAAMERDQRVLIRIPIDRAGPDTHG